MKKVLISAARCVGLLFVLCLYTTAIRCQSLSDAPLSADSVLRAGVSGRHVGHGESKSSPIFITSADGRHDTVVITTKSDYYQYVDTLTTVTANADSVLRVRDEVVLPDSSDRRGHYIEAHVGLGYGTLGYKLEGDDNKLNGSFSALLQLQYAYFFHQHWGVGAGLWFTNYTSHAHLAGDYYFERQTDSDTEPEYTHHSHINKWRERETIHNLGIPISLQTQWWNKSGDAGFFAALGIAPSFSVGKKYHVLDGEITHRGLYPNWNLTLEDMYEFGTIDYTDRDESKGSLSVKPAIGVFLDAGALLNVAPQIDIFVGGYFNYTFNDVNKSDKHPLGWGGEDYAFMHKYDGAYATDLAGKSHPWQVGVKVGVHWRHIAKPKTVHIDYYDHFTRLDTLVTLLERVDTVSTQHSDTFFTPIKHAARMVEKFNKIYFDFDSSVLNEESKNYLRSINDVLAHTSDSVRISIQGHASKEGLKKHNEALARRRAQRVADYLVEQGLDRKRIEVRGFGSSVENDENVNHTLNMDRRVEVKVILGEGANKYSNQIEYEK